MDFNFNFNLEDFQTKLIILTNNLRFLITEQPIPQALNQQYDSCMRRVE
jgi:hypothetical protein